MPADPRTDAEPPADGSVTAWLDDLRAGDPNAASHLWGRYFRRMMGLARQRLRAAANLPDDEEDVALSAFDSFCRAAERGRFPALADRDGLWVLLFSLTARKAAALIARERCQKRGGSAGREDGFDLDALSAAGPTPAAAAEMAEEVRRLFDRLPGAALRQIALLKMEGYTTEEIARRLDCVPRTVERKLGVIRAVWSEPGP